MSEEIGTLVARVVADNEQFRSDMVKMSRTLETNTARMNTALAKVNSGFGSLGTIIRKLNPLLAVFGVSLTAGGLVRLGRDAIATGDALENAGRKAGVGAESLQRYRYALSQLSDITRVEVDEALAQFNRRLGDAIEGNGEGAAALRALNVSLRDQSGALRSTESVLSETLEKLAGVESGAIRAARAADLFGRSAGDSMAAALDRGADAMEALRAATPGVISNENVALAAELNDEFDRLATTIGGNLKSALIEATAEAGDFFGIIDIGPVTEAMIKVRDLQELVERNREFLAQNPGFGGMAGNQRGLRETEARLEQARIELSILRSLASGARFPDLSKPPEDTASMGVPFDELPNIVAELEQLERERAAAAAMVVTELEKQKDLALQLFDAQAAAVTAEQDKLRAVQDKRKAEENALAEAIQAKALAKNDETVTAMERSWESFGQSMGRSFEDTLAGAFLGIETGFKDMLKRMLAQAAAAGLMNAVASTATGGAATFFNFLGFGTGSGSGGFAKKPEFDGGIVQNNYYTGIVDVREIDRRMAQSNQKLRADLAYESSRGRA